jgi:hypothetical protein
MPGWLLSRLGSQVASIGAAAVSMLIRLGGTRDEVDVLAVGRD